MLKIDLDFYEFLTYRKGFGSLESKPFLHLVAHVSNSKRPHSARECALAHFFSVIKLESFQSGCHINVETTIIYHKENKKGGLG